jgi:tetratricopeptide (TPR) repeat protein
MKYPKELYLGLSLIVAISGCHRRPARASEVHRGDELFAEKKYSQATKAYYAAARNGEPDAKLYLKVVTTGLHQGPLNLVLEAAGRAADLSPSDVEVQLLAARMMLPMRKYDEVLHRLQKVVANNPNNATLFVEMGNATAHLASSIVALTLGASARDLDEFSGVARKSRPGITPSSSPGNTSEGDAQAETLFRRAITIDPSAEKPQLAFANFLWATDRVKDSEPVLRDLVDRHPENALASLAIGQYYVLTGRTKEGERYLKVAVADTASRADVSNVTSMDGQARVAFADVYLHTTSSQNGINLLNLSDDGGNAAIAARFALADLYLRSRRDDDAIASLATIPKSHRSHAAVRIASAELRAGKNEQALSRLSEVIDQHLETVQEAMQLKAQLLVALNRPAEAMELAIASAKASPNSDAARRTLAQVLVATGDLENAFDEYSETTRLNITAGDPYVQLARVALALGRTDDAVTAAREGARLKGSDREATLTLVRALVASGDTFNADVQLKPLLAREPGSADVLAQLGAVHAARGTDDAARAAFTKALHSDPNCADALAGLVSLDLKQNQTDAARKRAEAALAAHPQDVRVLQIAARVYAAGNDTQRLDEISRKVVQLDPTDMTAALAVKPPETLHVLESLLQRRPRALEARFALGMLLERMGRTDEARKQYETVLAEPARPDNARLRGRAMARKQAL